MKAKLRMILVMILFGSIGLFVRFIPLASAGIAFSRALIGSLFLVLLKTVAGENKTIPIPKESRIPLVASGIFLGLNWMLLFEAYKQTTIAQATFLYYLGPLFVFVYSILFLKEQLSFSKVLSLLLAFAGVICLLQQTGFYGCSLSKSGVGYGISAALCYAGVMLINAKLKNVPSDRRTIAQLTVSAFIMGVYILFQGDIQFAMTKFQWFLLLIIGILHTGIAYQLYFSALGELEASEAALLSYVDPLAALLFSVVFLQEPLSVLEWLGGALILVSALLQTYSASLHAKKTIKRGKIPTE